MSVDGDHIIQRAEEIVAEYIRRYSLPDEIERDDCVSVVIEGLLEVHTSEDFDEVTSGLEWQAGHKDIINYLDKEAHQTGRAWEQP